MSSLERKLPEQALNQLNQLKYSLRKLPSEISIFHIELFKQLIQSKNAPSLHHIQAQWIKQIKEQVDHDQKYKLKVNSYLKITNPKKPLVVQPVIISSETKEEISKVLAQINFKYILELIKTLLKIQKQYESLQRQFFKQAISSARNKDDQKIQSLEADLDNLTQKLQRKVSELVLVQKQLIEQKAHNQKLMLSNDQLVRKCQQLTRELLSNNQRISTLEESIRDLKNINEKKHNQLMQNHLKQTRNYQDIIKNLKIVNQNTNGELKDKEEQILYLKLQLQQLRSDYNKEHAKLNAIQDEFKKNKDLLQQITRMLNERQ